MDSIPIIFILFIVFLILGGWFIAEMVSKKATKLHKSNSKEMKILMKEKERLESSISKESERLTRVSEECDALRQFEASIPSLKTNCSKLTQDLSQSLENIDQLRLKLKKREYSSNPVTSDVLMILEEFFPNAQERELIEQEKLKGTFGRIKNSIGDVEDST